MAEQTTSQQDEQQMVNVILANVGTVICFRSGNPSDEKLVLPLFEPYIEKGEIANLPSYNFYMRVSAQKSQEPLSGETVMLTDGEQDREKSIRHSREMYGNRHKPLADTNTKQIHGTNPAKSGRARPIPRGNA